MATVDKIKEERIKKKKRFEEEGINPYPSSTNRTHSIKKALKLFIPFSFLKKKVVLAGRIRLVREHGSICFLNIKDGTGTIQVFMKKELLERYDFFLENFDVGDFVEIRGRLIKTKTGERTIEAKGFRILTKSLRPLPEKFHGLQDKEERYRKRYLDFIFNPEVKELFYKKSKFWSSMRSFLERGGFLEVYTPVLENKAGGANAQPFKTHHNALDMDVYLRICMGELWQKKLMVGGFDKTFEIGRQFRNEGVSPEHLQDYMQMEFYWAYADYEMGMELVKRLYRYVAEETFGTQKFEIFGFHVNLADKWEMIDYRETILDRFDVDIDEMDEDDLREELDELEIEHESEVGRGRLIDTLWKEVRKSIAGPAFLVGHPVDVSPLSKRDEDNLSRTERFQVILAGSEMGNGYSELNDPIDQAERFRAGEEARERGDEEAHVDDQSFVKALEYGMPPTCGFGVSERLFSFLAGISIKEATMFPLMKSRG